MISLKYQHLLRKTAVVNNDGSRALFGVMVIPHDQAYFHKPIFAPDEIPSQTKSSHMRYGRFATVSG
jgi:hypothetical protein